MKKKILTCLAVAGLITMGSTVNTYAKTDAYLIKDSKSGVLYQYDLETLKNSFLDYTEYGKAPFYEEFIGKIQAFGGTYAYHDSTKKYVSFETVSEAFLNAQEQGKGFSLGDYTESSEAKAMTGIPETVKNLKVTDGKAVYEDIKTDGSTTPEESEDLEVISIE
ncbi:hypothetical protein RBU49_00605 [Clostridium sp. MB40-C1]|uniref:hypothetical protein n=1 Tax=Clostridium sp. MB40-C1 TaxID=3070996 RepID=UPI0027E0FA48|nr:hypothetical protein [Clostridium sp. MB40-C1]WMJ80777.1 hypothetical protein RBU49_00605 [Clostridium sp. MB40-C1]